MEILQREAVYLWYYVSVQLSQIFWYWVLGMVLGSAVSVFAKNAIHHAFASLNCALPNTLGIVIASFLGIASPLCMYGTIPLAASFAQGGMKESWLAAFMMASIMLNPQLIIYSAALGPTLLAVRIISSLCCGIAAGVLVQLCAGGRFFDFQSLGAVPNNRDTDRRLLMRYLKNLGRNLRATGPYFMLGVLLAALFQRYVPAETMTALFGGNEALGVLMAATIGVPLYACGGGTVPLLQQWLWNGMSAGSATAFMITGPATKITNLGALKMALGVRHFLAYLVFVALFALFSGWLVNGFLPTSDIL